MSREKSLVKKLYYSELEKLDSYDLSTNTFVEVKTGSGEMYGRYTPNPRNGKFIMILEPGVYNILVTNDGFMTTETKIRIYDKSNYTPELSRDFYLKPKANLLLK